MLVNTTATQSAITASNPNRSWASAPFTSVRGASSASVANCRAAITPAAPAVDAVSIAYHPRGQRGVSAPTSNNTSAPPSSTMYGASAYHSMVGATKSAVTSTV